MTQNESAHMTTTISEIKEVARETYEVTLKKPEGFDFVAGQYVRLSLQRV